MTKSFHLRDSKFGWVVTGSSTQGNTLQIFLLKVVVHIQKKFNNRKTSTLYKTSEGLRDDHIFQTTRRDKHGRFVVKLPFKENSSKVVDSLCNAEK